MQKTVTLEIADAEFSQANQAALQSGFDINESLNIAVAKK